MSTNAVYVLEKTENDANFGFRLLHRPGSAHLIIDNVKSNSPASRGGLQAGMLLAGVNGTSVVDKSITEATHLIRMMSGNRLVFEIAPSEEDIYGNADPNSTILQQQQQQSSRPSSTSSASSSSKSSSLSARPKSHSQLSATTPAIIVEDAESQENRSAATSVASSVSAVCVETNEGGKVVAIETTTVITQPKRPPESNSASSKSRTPASSFASSSSSSLPPPATIKAPSNPVVVEQVAHTAEKARKSRNFNPEDQPYPVIWHHLKKWPSKAGFGLTVARVGDEPLMLTAVEENTPAFCSSLRAGMILCQVGSTSVTDCTQAEAAELIKECGEEVRILVATKATWAWLVECGMTLENCLHQLQQDTYDPPPPIPTTSIPEEPHMPLY